ncbi:MAG: hypothetical protein GY898_05940 [Proteobacteria bacterium]|nr:hypothetical protein [Pseudomonadota bacterium]
MPRFLPLLSLALLAACSPRPTDNPAPVTLDCNVVGSTCLLPWPSSVFTEVDNRTASGLNVVLSEAASFAGLKPVFDFEAPDGFSSIGSMAAYIPDGVDPALIPVDYAASLREDAAMHVIDADATSEEYGRRLPFHADVVDSADGGALLTLTPLEAFKPSGRYAVLMTTDVIAPTEAITGLLGEGPVPDGLEELADYYADLVRLAKVEVGIHPRDIGLLWDFHIRSDEETTADLRSMAAFGQQWIADHPTTPTLSEPYQLYDRTAFDLSFTVPLWRADRFDPLHRDADGVPEPVGELEVHGYLMLADNVTPETHATPILFGHGLGVTAEQMQPTLAGLDLDAGPYAIAAFDFDLHGERGEELDDIIELTGNMNFEGFAAAMLQSAIDTLVATDMMKTMPPLPQVGDVVTDGPVLYLGQSMGSLVGVLAAAISTDLTGAVFNVGGGGLSNVLRHGEIVDVIGMRDALEVLVANGPPDDFPADLGYDVLLVVGQPGLDRGDPMIFAHHVLKNRLVDAPAPAVLLQESTGDGIIPNMMTEAMARRMELTLIEPIQLGAPGLERASAPTCGSPATGLAQFTVTDIPFQAHLALEEVPVQRQVMTWFDSFVDADPDNDGNIAFTSFGQVSECP